MKRSHIEIGQSGEDFVVRQLEQHSHTIIDRNWRIREGEIDIVSIDRDGVLHFVEVKTRTSVAYGHPFEAITAEKAHRLQKLAMAWLATHSSLGRDYSIDVAAVLALSTGQLSCEIREGVL